MENSVIPPFDIDGGVGLAFARGLSVAGLFLVFGSLLAWSTVAPAALRLMSPKAAAQTKQELRRLIYVAFVVASMAALAWLWAEAASIAETASPVETFAALPKVVSHTHFGALVALRLGALALAAAAFRAIPGRLWVATALAFIALALQAGHSHAASMYGGISILLVCDMTHIIAGGAWLGGLPALMLLVRRREPAAARAASRRFSPMAMACVAAICATAVYQSWVLIGSVPGLVGVAYGWIAGFKTLLLCVLIVFAAVNRRTLTPALTGARPFDATRALWRSIGLETGVGLLVVLAAGVLTSLPPSMHVQPAWPFSAMVSLDAMREDPDIQREVLIAACVLLAGAALFAASCFARRGRLPAAVLAAATIWFTVPHFQPVLVPAYPTSYFKSPTEFSADSIASGSALFSANCAACHGENGRGDGRLAKTLPVPPANLTAAHLWMHSDGELFWWLTHGITAPSGAVAMPGFAGTLSPDQRWNLIDYVRAHNAGLAYQAHGIWPAPLQAPAVVFQCARSTMALTDLRGTFLLLTAEPPAHAGAPPALSVAPASGEGHPACSTTDTAAPMAYAILAGLPVAELPGAAFIIDESGWLRVAKRGGWANTAGLAAEITSLRAHPITGMSKPMPMKMPM